MFALGQYHRLQWNVISILSDLFFKLKVSLYSPEFILQFWLFSLSMPLTSNQTVYKCHHNSSLEEYCKPDDEHCPISERSFFFVLFTKEPFSQHMDLLTLSFFSNKWFSPSHFRPEWSSTVNMKVLLAGFPFYARSLLHRETAIFLVSSLLLTLLGRPSLWRLLDIPNCVYYGFTLTQTCYWIVRTHACTHAPTYVHI